MCRRGKSDLGKFCKQLFGAVSDNSNIMMKKLLFTLCFYLLFGFVTASQAAVVSYSFPSNTVYYYPSYYPGYPWSYAFWNSYNAPSFRHKQYPKGSYYSWKRNNFYYAKLSEQKMLIYKQLHAPGQSINPLDDPKFLNDVKVYSLPAEPQITTTPKQKEN